MRVMTTNVPLVTMSDAGYNQVVSEYVLSANIAIECYTKLNANSVSVSSKGREKLFL